MMGNKEDEAKRKLLKGLTDPAKHNPYHRERLKKDAAKAKAVEAALKKRKGKHTRRHGDDGVIDTGMFGS
jgi:hypothetical protein